MTTVKFPGVIGIGNALVDIMKLLKDDSLLSEFNLPKGSMTLVGRKLSEDIQSATSHLETKITTGGSVANAINGVANLGVPSAFIGSVANDDMGVLFKEELEKLGVETFIKKSDTRTGRAVALVSGDGERTFATYLGAAIEMGAEDIKPELFDGYSYFFIEGYLVQNHALILEAARVAKLAGLTVALDLASFNIVEMNLELINELVDNYIDIVFSNEEEAKSFTGEEPEVALDKIALRCDIAVVKVGSKGAFIKQGSKKWKIPSLGKTPIDTTGAGDSFAAGFLAGLAKGYDIEKAGKLGALLAGNVVTVVGAQLTTEIWDEIKSTEAGL
jgi:sugar/nucleoside kinase (ribokinase family)